MSATPQASSVRLGIRLLLAVLVALAIPALVSAQAHAATVTGKVGYVPGVYGYGTAHCNPGYTRSIAVGGPWVARVIHRMVAPREPRPFVGNRSSRSGRDRAGGAGGVPRKRPASRLGMRGSIVSTSRRAS